VPGSACHGITSRKASQAHSGTSPNERAGRWASRTSVQNVADSASWAISRSDTSRASLALATFSLPNVNVSSGCTRLGSISTGIGIVSTWSSSTRSPRTCGPSYSGAARASTSGLSTSPGTMTEKNGCPIRSVRNAMVWTVSVNAIVNCSTLPDSSVLLKLEFDRVKPPSLLHPSNGVFLGVGLT
jgi:hypothetical protein